MRRSAQLSFVNRCFLKDEPIILCLTYFCFHRTVLSKKYLEEFDGKSIFYACRQNGSKTEKNFCYSKLTSAVLVSHFRGLLIVIFRRIKCSEEYQVKNCCFLSFVLKFSTKTYMFTKHRKNWDSLYCLIGSSVQWYSEKANLIQNFLFMVLIEKFSVHPRVIWV